MTELWPLITLGVCFVTLLLLAREIQTANDLPTRLLALAIWLRMTTASLADYTTEPLVAGLSVNAIAAIAVILSAILVLRVGELALRGLWPIYFFLTVAIASGVSNNLPGPTIQLLISWTYMICIALLLRRSAMRHGCDQALRYLFPAFALPVVLGLLSFLVGYGRLSEHDSSTSYRAGFVHESVFATTVFISLSVALIIKWRYTALRFAFVGLALAAIVLSNYRTVVLALIPAVVLIGYGLFGKLTPQRFRPAILVAGAFVAGLAMTWLIENIPERYQDVVKIFTLQGTPLADAGSLTLAERKIGSGRLLLWNLYLGDYVRADSFTILFGFGPGHANQQAHLYTHAHNNFIFWLYSLGIFGLGALLSLYLRPLLVALQFRDGHYRANLTAALIGFIIISLATSPFVVIEGLLFYAIITGIVLAVASTQETRRNCPRGWRHAV